MADIGIFMVGLVAGILLCVGMLAKVKREQDAANEMYVRSQMREPLPDTEDSATESGLSVLETLSLERELGKPQPRLPDVRKWPAGSGLLR